MKSMLEEYAARPISHQQAADEAFSRWPRIDAVISPS
jgi:hypothetical protein